MRTIAVDWSGARSGAHKTIWIAEAVDGDITFLENGRDREQVAAWLIDQPGPFVVGFDFAFSLPAWFLREQGFHTAPDLWRTLAEGAAERWLAECPYPFWGRPGVRKPAGIEHRRRTEHQSAHNPKSVFQIGGAGAVGTGSLRGMPVLHVLRENDFAVWPFDDRADRTVIEIYPRALTGPVTKSDPHARRQYLDERYRALDDATRAVVASSEDAFDAAISALVMNAHRAALQSLRPATDDTERLEGAIWTP